MSYSALRHPASTAGRAQGRCSGSACVILNQLDMRHRCAIFSTRIILSLHMLVQLFHSLGKMLFLGLMSKRTYAYQAMVLIMKG